MSPKPQLLVHVGMHKTGTTFLQQFYFPTLEKVYCFSNIDGLKRRNPDTNIQNYLISKEALSGIAWNAQWKLGQPNDWSWIHSFDAMIRHLKVLHPHARIMIFFRKHGDILISMYKQYIQEGGTLPFELFYGEKGVIGPQDLSYRHRIDRLKEEFGEIDFLSYEKLKEIGISYLDDYFEQLGIKRVEEVPNKKSANRSITGWKIKLLRSANKIFPKIPDRLRRFLIINKLSPRALVQYGLSFIELSDSLKLIQARDEVNREFQEDWLYFESVSWKQACKNGISA